MELHPPLSAGSISLRLYPHDELDPVDAVAELRAQAALAAAAGFDGVMTSEHHGGFAGYLPNPIQAAGWALESMPQGWAAPCPLLLPLRPAALVVEELAWLAVRFPGRVGAGVAAGSRVEDFIALGLTKEDLTARFTAGFALLATLLDPGARPATTIGENDHLAPDPDASALLAADPAVARCRHRPVPIVSAAMSRAAVERAAALGAGILLDSLSSLDRARALVDAYHHAGGRGPTILIRRMWIGPVPGEAVARQVERYQGYASPTAQQHWTGDQLAGGTDAAEVAEGLAEARRASGADALNLRLHAPGIALDAVRDQIVGAAAVVDRLRR